MNEFINLTINTIKNISVWSVLDILVVAYIFYKSYMLIKDTRAEQLLKGILFIVVLIPISYVLRLNMLYVILNKTITIGVLTIVIIFQPEIRRALEHLGRSAFDDIHTVQDKEEINKTINEVVIAVDALAKTKTGALIVIEQSTGLGDFIASGTRIDGLVSSAMLENIFVVNTPLHDGATIIKNSRIVASGCVLPLTSNNDINKKLGTRHRAAIGLSEICDAIIIIVSEETGTISLAINGRLTRNYDKEKLRTILGKVIENKQSKRVKTAGERVKVWIRKVVKNDK